MIRPGTLDDVDALVELGRLLHDTSSYAGLNYSAEKVRATLRRLIGSVEAPAEGVVFVLEMDGLVRGGIAGSVTEYWFGHDLHGFDYSFFVHPDSRNGYSAMRLLLSFEHWCWRKGATSVRIGITTGIKVEGTAALYRSCGYAQNGILFIKERDHGN